MKFKYSKSYIIDIKRHGHITCVVTHNKKVKHKLNKQDSKYIKCE